MKKYTFLLIVFLCLFSLSESGWSQNPTYTKESWSLTTPLTGSQTYVARDTIRLSKQFNYKSQSGSTFHAKIDPTLVFAPSDQSYMSENGEFTSDPTQGAAVGNFEGILDVNEVGGATYSIPIDCPSGINNMQPSISLVYNSQSGNGIAGMGWSIGGLSMISRVPETLYYDYARSNIIWDRKSPLVWDGQQIRTGNYTSVDSIIYYSEYGIESIKGYAVKSWGPSYIKIVTKEGLELQYGDPASSASYFMLTHQGNNADNFSKVKNKGWALSQIVDKNNNYIKYNYSSDEEIQDNGIILSSSNRITSIEYGNTADNSPVGKIVFEYKEMNLPYIKYINGALNKEGMILDNIQVLDYNDFLHRKYTLVYEEKEDNNSFLTEIKKENGSGEFFPPLQFKWNHVDYTLSEVQTDVFPAEVEEEGYFLWDCQKIYGDFTGDGLTDVVCKYTYKKKDGKDKKYNWVAYKRKSDNSGYEYVYHRSFNNDSETIFLFADRDHDGKDELYIGSFFEDTAYPYMTIHKYSYHETTGNFYSAHQDIYSVYVSREEYNTRHSSLLIPFDSSGSGRIDFLLVCGNNNKVWYIDMHTSTPNRIQGSKVIDPKEKSRIYITDIDGNGKPEIMYIHENTTSFHEFNPYKKVYSTDKFNHEDFIYTGDFNGDGYTDFIVRKINQRTNTVFLSTGSSLVETSWGSDIYDSKAGSYEKRNKDNGEIENISIHPNKFLVDINKDGRTDVIVSGINNYNERFTYLKIFLSTGNGFEHITEKEYYYEDMLSIYGNGNINQITTPSLFTHNWDQSFIYYVDVGSNQHGYKINKIINSFNQELTIGYNYWHLDYKLGNNVVRDAEQLSKYSQNSGSLLGFEVVNNVKGNDLDLSFDYQEPSFHFSYKGFHGFKKIRKVDNIHSLIYETEKRFNETYYMFYPYRENILTTQGDSISCTTGYYSFSSKPNKTHFYKMRQISSESKDFLKNTILNKNYSQYDDSENPGKVETDCGDGISTTEEYVYTEAGSLFKNKIHSQSIEYKKTGLPTIKKQDHYYYDTQGNLVLHTQDSLSTKKVQTFYSDYDKYGNVGNITAKAGVISRSKSYNYSSTGRFLTREINHSFNDTVFYLYDENKSQLKSKTDYLGTTNYQYNGFGELMQTSYPDGIKSIQTLQWAGNQGPQEALYYSYSENSGSSPIKIWYDAQGRKIQEESYGLNKAKIFTDYTYYPDGNLNTVSEPYFENEVKKESEEYIYDNFGRLLEKRTPMGLTEYIYNGKTVQVNFPTGTKKTAVNSAGWVVSEETNGKAVAFTHYADGSVKTATPEGGTSVSMKYDIHGNRTELIDPDAGTICSEYDSWGQLIKETQSVHLSANPVITSYSYHPSGLVKHKRRGRERTDYEYDSFYRLLRIALTDTIANKTTSQSYSYDNWDRIIQIKDSVERGKVFISSTEYDKLGRTRKEIFPGGYYVTNHYDSYSNLKKVVDEAGNLIWEVKDINAKGQILKTQKGNKETYFVYDDRGFPEMIRTSGIMDMHYLFDEKGNLFSRTDSIGKYLSTAGHYKEVFQYDNLNRLTDWTIYKNGVQQEKRSQVYKPGKSQIDSKIGYGTDFAYGEENHKPHALTSFIPESGTGAFSVDQQITYTDFKKMKSITQGTTALNLTYGVDEQRIKSVLSTPSGTIIRYYLGSYEEETKNGKTRKIHYLSGGDGLAAIYVKNTSSSKDSLYYAYSDYQGSLIALTTEKGMVKERYAYDPWGLRRNPVDWSRNDTRTAFIFNRGYTLHEHLTAFNLINMNGRMYDPGAGMFFSPDPYIQAPGDWLNYNRYSYCLNNPFLYTDPSGEFIFSLFLGPVGAVIDAACWGAVIGGASYTASVAISNGGFTNWDWGQFGKSVGVGALSGSVTFGIGEAFSAMGNFAGTFETEAIRGFTHGLAHGGISTIQGGDFLTGFISGTLSSWTASGYSCSMLSEKFGDVGMLGFSALSGGIGGWATSDNFWYGAGIGLISSELNHIQHKTEEYKFFHRLRKHYEGGKGADFKIKKRELQYLIKKGNIDYVNAVDVGNGYYSAIIDFYDSNKDLALSFGRATITYKMDNNKYIYNNFYDRYDFDSKPWGTRSVPNEIITRAYNLYSKGTAFDIYYRKP